MKTAYTIVTCLGCDETNFIEQVQRSQDAADVIKTITQFWALTWDKLDDEVIAQVLSIEQDAGNEYSIGELEREFERSQFEAHRFLNCEWLKCFYKKMEIK